LTDTAWSTACPDWEDRLLSGRSLVPDLPLFESERERALRVFNRLRVPDMVGRPTMGEVAGPWLLPIIGAIFGSYDPLAHRRMINEFFWLIPKKNTKSSSAAAIMVEALILNERPEGEYVLVAPTKEIADISFKQAAGTIRADAELSKLFQIQFHIRTITHRRTGATLKVKAADTDVITGGKQVGTLIDELHVLAAKKNAADIMVELRGALAARPDGFLITVTTQSKAPPQGVFKAELEKARAVRDGKLSLPLLPIIYELPTHLAKDGGWKERKYWPVVNPNYGRSVRPEFLEEQLSTAENDGKVALDLFASQHFNVQIGQSTNYDGWTGADYWGSAAEPGLTLDELLARCEVATVGVDGGGLDDLYGVCIIGRERGDADVRFRRWFAWNHTWCAKIALERRKSEQAKYADFAKAGEMTVVDNLDDAEVEIAEIIKSVDDAELLAGIGMDPVGAKSLTDKLACVGIGLDRIEAVSQGYKLNGIIVDCERRLFSRTLVHGGQAIMSWAVGNAKLEMKGNAAVITKQASGKAKIDPLMALLDAATLMANHPEPVSAGAPEIFVL
jgi:phage terminase large subunit-like protein